MAQDAARELGGVIEAMYAAAEGTIAWDHALEELRALMGGQLAAMFYQDGSTVHSDDFVALRGYNPAAIDAYMSHFAARDARAAAFFSMAAGEVYADDISLPYAAIRNSEIIQDFFRPLGAGQAMGARLFNGDGRSGVLSVQMPFDAGGLAAGQVAAFTALVPHVLRALRVHRQLQRSQARAAALHDSLDRLPTAVFLLHLDGRIAWANHAAETIVRSAGRGLHAVHGRLAAHGALANEALQTAIRQTAAIARPPDILRVPRADGPPLGIMLAPSNGLVLAFVADPAAPMATDTHALARMFGLSAAEARAAAGIAAGQNPAAIAAARGVSIETVRAQLKVAMAKMGVHTQAQLAVAVCRVAGIRRAPE